MSELGPPQEDALRPGLNVDIRRTDGRVHPAVVSAVRSRLVTVEWFENGQTKGKDVDRQTLVALNPALARASPHLASHRKDSAASIGGTPVLHRKATAASLPCAPVLKEDNNDLCNELTRELERAAQLSLALSKKQAAEAGAQHQQNQHRQQQVVEQEEAEAVADLLRRYRAVVDVSDLWMTTDVRLLTRMLSTRALEDDTWLRELEDLVSVKMELLSNLRDAVNKLRKIKDSTRNFAREADGNGRR
ncbi:kinesin-like protein KIF2B [Dermacentor albipictus]|uniref:kinesin-like protein KIF2B n=1 Tax=Dermacentor albipictus TaxID=60249 RepID=UPI0031FDE116